MPSYIASNNNRFYVGIEASYGVAAATALSRIPAVSLKAKHQAERLQRHDKTGTRTHLGLPQNRRFRTSLDLTTYMAAWTDTSKGPVHGSLIEAALGKSGAKHAGGTLTSTNGTRATFSAAHGLQPGHAVAAGGEIRFVTAVADDHNVILNAPFTGTGAGTTTSATCSYVPAADLKSVTIMDYWSPTGAVQRMLCGAAIDGFEIQVNGDFHQFKFKGYAQDVVDTTSFSDGQAAMTAFPPEPESSDFDYSLIPGHLGQAWIGSVPGQVFTLASARVSFTNNTDLRAREFGQTLPAAIVPGVRNVMVDFSLYAQDDTQCADLYRAARQQEPVSVMLQLGQQEGQLCGIYLNNVILQVPEFVDKETRLIWHFQQCRAQGSGDDEISIAFA